MQQFKHPWRKESIAKQANSQTFALFSGFE